MAKKNPHLGSTLESVLREEGIYEDAKTHALKAVLAYKLEEAVKAQNLSKARMAKRMETSRSQLDRLLDPENEGVPRLPSGCSTLSLNSANPSRL